MPTLTSPRNPMLKEIRKAIARGTATEQGFAVAEGFHLLEEALRSDCDISAVFAAESVRSAVESHVRGLRSIRVVVLADDVFQSLAATESSQGVIALARPPQWTCGPDLPGPCARSCSGRCARSRKCGNDPACRRGLRSNGRGIFERYGKPIQSEVLARIGGIGFSRPAGCGSGSASSSGRGTATPGRTVRADA